MSKKRHGHSEFEVPKKEIILWKSKEDRRHLLNRSNLSRQYNHYDSSGQRLKSE